MIGNISKFAVALAFSATASIAGAAEIILFEHPGFAGRQVELNNYTPSVSATGFNDRTSSVVVTSGRWEVCTDDQFRGFCAILGPGEYRVLDERLNDRISSVREVGSTGRAEDMRRGGPRASIQLYTAPGFRGQTVQFDGDAPNFSEHGFNDRAASVVVNEGTWVLCTDAGFRGTCRTYAPGRYPDLGYGMTRSVSSAQIVRARDNSQARMRGGWNRPADNDGGMHGGSVALYTGPNFTGDSLQVSSNVVDFGPIGFNDATESMVIQSGTWEVCTDAYFRGRCRVMGPGQYPRLDQSLAGLISSIRAAVPMQGQVPMPAPNRGQARSDVELFTAPNFGGRRLTTNDNMQNFDANDFNDRFASIIIHQGSWEMCVDVNYGGGCTVFGPGRYPQIGGLTSQISSMRRVY